MYFGEGIGNLALMSVKAIAPRTVFFRKVTTAFGEGRL
jgi:hypothetical protein